MLFSPVKKCELELSHTGTHLRIVLAFTHFLSHISANFRDTRVILVLFIRNEKVELRVFFDLNTEFVETLDRSVTSEEVLRTRSECNDLEVLNTDNCTSDRYEICDHLSDIFSCSDRIFRNISVKMSHTEVV